MNPKSNAENLLLTYRVGSDLVSTNAAAVHQEIRGLLRPSENESTKWNIFRLDLAGAKMVDSMGLNVVVSVLKEIQKRGARMQITYANPNVLRTFTFTRLDKHVELVKA